MKNLSPTYSISLIYFSHIISYFIYSISYFIHYIYYFIQFMLKHLSGLKGSWVMTEKVYFGFMYSEWLVLFPMWPSRLKGKTKSLVLRIVFVRAKTEKQFTYFHGWQNSRFTASTQLAILFSCIPYKMYCMFLFSLFPITTLNSPTHRFIS